MSKVIEGISAETMEAGALAICGSVNYLASENGVYAIYRSEHESYKCHMKAAITALFASGEVVLRKDVEELVAFVQRVADEGFYGEMNSSVDLVKILDEHKDGADEALTRFTDTEK